MLPGHIPPPPGTLCGAAPQVQTNLMSGVRTAVQESARATLQGTQGVVAPAVRAALAELGAAGSPLQVRCGCGEGGGGCGVALLYRTTS